MISESNVILESCDGIQLKKGIEIVKVSKTLANMLEDIDGLELSKFIIPIPICDSLVLSKLLKWCELWIQNQRDIPETKIDSNWQQEFLSDIDLKMSFDCILASNFLEIDSLLKVLTDKIRGMFESKSVQEIRTNFGIQNDFTPEEENQIKTENEWCENI